MKKKVRAIVISASSDIGTELCKFWHKQGWEIFGTFRRSSEEINLLREKYGAHLVSCDLQELDSVIQACDQLIGLCGTWDVLVLAAGDLDPIGNFQEVNFDDWERGVQVNLLRQLRIVHKLLPFRNIQSPLSEPTVLFFAGGGTNNAVLHYSSYTLSKIALIKMSELLDAEIPDTRFVILGPGCVKTKIHEATLRPNTTAAGANYQKTLERLAKSECTPMSKVIESCHWLVTTPCKAVRGRNFSTASDLWGTADLERVLQQDQDMYKLRRSGNSWGKCKV